MPTGATTDEREEDVFEAQLLLDVLDLGRRHQRLELGERAVDEDPALVEDPDPVGELRRLVRLQRAYLKLNEGDEAVAAGDVPRALGLYREATSIVPDAATNGEAAFWVGITLADTGDVEGAIPWLSRAYLQDERWARLVPRLVAARLLPDDDELVRRLVEGMKKGK